jgi:membrane protein DedA with SNARE-associated domain
MQHIARGETLSDWIIRMLEKTGYAGVAVLMFLENVFPPIPSEVIMPFAGFASAQGHFQLPFVIVAGAIGSLAGAAFWYVIALRVGEQRLCDWTARHGRWMAVSPDEIDRAIKWFDQRAGKAVLFGRLVPAVRTFISVPAGIAEMPLRRFIIYSSLGTFAWCTLLTAAGFILGQRFEEVGKYLNVVTTILMVGLGAWYLYRVITFRRR